MATLLFLPPETLVRIFNAVKPNDLKSLRSTSKHTERVATPLFAEQFLTNRRHVLASQSIEVLEKIVTHPYFGCFVKSIAFNCVRSIPPDEPDEEDITEVIEPGETPDSLSQRSKQMVLNSLTDERCLDKRSTEMLGHSMKTESSVNESSEYSGTGVAIFTKAAMNTTDSSRSILNNAITPTTLSLESEHYDTLCQMKEPLPRPGSFENRSTRAESKVNAIADDEEVFSGLSKAMTALSIQATPVFVLKKNDQEDATKWAQDLEHSLDRITLKHYSNRNVSAKLPEGLPIRANDSETGDWATQVNWHLENVFQKHQSGA